MLGMGMVNRFFFSPPPGDLRQIAAFGSTADLVIETPPVATSWQEGLDRELKFNDFIASPWAAITVWVLADKPYSLFTKSHSLGMYAYRVVVTMEDGSRLEPMQTFTPAKERGEEQAGWFQLNLLQSFAYGIGDVARLLSYGHDEPTRRAQVERTNMLPLMHEAVARLPPGQRERLRTVSVLVAPCSTSTTYVGVIPQRTDDWVEFFVFDAVTKSYHYQTMVQRHSVQGRDARLPDYLPFLFE
jgi:hypothetical protein